MSDEPRLLSLFQLAQAGLTSTSLLHEIRQPVFALQALAQRGASAGWSDAEQADLENVVGHLREILETWSPVGRPEPEQLHDVAVVLDQALQMLRSEVERSAVTLSWERPDLPVWSTQRPGLARQLVMNLVRNAVDAVAGEPDPHVSLTLIPGPDLVIEVRDNGPGVPEAILQGLFHPFATTKGTGGTGLGLFVCRALCRAAGGDVTLAREGEYTVARAWFSTTAGSTQAESLVVDGEAGLDQRGPVG